jgi:outer membrane protein TolC
MRRPIKYAVLGAMLAAAVICARAQISLSSAVDLALRNDPRMKMAQADLDKARAAVAQTHDAYVPNIGVNAGYGQSTGVPLGVPVVFSFASQSLLFSFAQMDNIRAAEAALSAAELLKRDMHDQIAEDVVVTYLNLEHTQQRQVALSQEYGFASRLSTIVQERLHAGEDTNMDSLRAKLTASQIHYQKLKTDDDFTALSDHLSRLVGLPGNQISPVAASIPPLPPLSALAAGPQESFGVEALVATARSKQETAFGEERYRFRPQASFFLNYSRIDTGPTNYVDYYPGFAGKSRDAASVGFQLSIPLFDRVRQDEAHEAQADATHALFEAQAQQNVFLEGRAKLRHSLEELSDQADIAADGQGIAQEQLNAVLAQLSANNADNGRPPLTPKDEQNARVAERARYIDLLDTEFDLQQAEVNLLRQTRQLDSWLRQNPGQTPTAPSVPITH